MTAPCRDELLEHSTLDHDELRKLMDDGRCPICDPSVTREEYQGVVYRIAVSSELKSRVIRSMKYRTTK